MPSSNLDAIIQMIAPGLEKLRDIATGDALVQLGVDVNIHQSARNLIENSPMLRQEVDAHKLAIIKAVYRLKSGEVVRLD